MMDSKMIKGLLYVKKGAYNDYNILNLVINQKLNYRKLNKIYTNKQNKQFYE